MRRATGWRLDLLTRGVISGLLLMGGAPAIAQTVNFSPATLSFSPAGPYSVPRDAAVGSQVAAAMASASGISSVDPDCDRQWHGNRSRQRRLSDQREWHRGQLL